MPTKGTQNETLGRQRLVSERINFQIKISIPNIYLINVFNNELNKNETQFKILIDRYLSQSLIKCIKIQYFSNFNSSTHYRENKFRLKIMRGKNSFPIHSIQFLIEKRSDSLMVKILFYRIAFQLKPKISTFWIKHKMNRKH